MIEPFFLFSKGRCFYAEKGDVWEAKVVRSGKMKLVPLLASEQDPIFQPYGQKPRRT